jgi:hypothetical protein
MKIGRTMIGRLRMDRAVEKFFETAARRLRSTWPAGSPQPGFLIVYEHARDGDWMVVAVQYAAVGRPKADDVKQFVLCRVNVESGAIIGPGERRPLGVGPELGNVMAPDGGASAVRAPIGV